MPLCGTAAIESGGQRIDSSPELASVLSPECDTRMCWEAGNDQVMLRISRSLVERTLVGYLGHPLDKPLHFELASLARLRALELPAVLSGGLRHPISRPGAAQAGAVAGRTGRLDPADLAPAQLQRDRPARAARSCRATCGGRRITARAAQRRAAGAGGRRQRAQSLQRFQGIPGRQPHAPSARPAHGTRAHRAAERGRVAGVALRFRTWAVSATTTRPATWKRPARRCGGTESARDSAPEPQAVPAPFPQNGITSLASSWLPSGRLRTSKSFCHFSVNSQPPWLA